MNKINKFVFKHILSIFLFSVFLLFVWCFAVYLFLSFQLKREVFPLIENSKQFLSEIINKNFDSDKIKNFVYEIEKSDYACYVNVINEKTFSENKKESFFISILKIAYPVKNNDSVIGWVEILPSYKLFCEIFSNGFNLSVLILSLFFLLCFFILIFYLCIQRYIIQPYNQIKIIINNILLNEEINVDENNGCELWEETLSDLKKLNNNVFDINTTMKLLFSASNVVGSDLELVNSVQLIFDIIKKRIKTSMSALFVPDESGHLKIVAKSGFIKNNIAFVSKDETNYIWNCYENFSEKIINDISVDDKTMLGELYEDNEGSFAAVPLINEDMVCTGVFVVITKKKNSFDSDCIGVVKSMSVYLVALINRMRYYQKIKETNRKLEIELQTASKELINTNDLVIKKVKDMNLISEIYSYASENIDIKDIIVYIIDKVKELVCVETAGILIYNEDKQELTSIKKSFGLNKDLNFYNKKGTIYSKVIESKNVVILNDTGGSRDFIKTNLSGHLNLKSAVFLPVTFKDEVIAIFVAVNKFDGIFGTYDIKTLKQVSVIVSRLIKR